LSDKVEEIDLRYVAVSDLPDNNDGIAAESWCVLPISGRRHYLAIEAVRIRDANGAVIGVLETLRDLSAKQMSETKFRNLAGLDALTGIANRRAFDDVLASNWRRAIRSSATISLIMVDIDHFKQFNDSLGHQRGDNCLKSVAETLGSQFRRTGDTPARYGGEEFAVILPDTDKAGAAKVAENIRAAVERRGLHHPASPVGAVVTVSVGVATANLETEIVSKS
jgi:diguanylate cyclase (GGDEF)-like protein